MSITKSRTPQPESRWRVLVLLTISGSHGSAFETEDSSADESTGSNELTPRFRLKIPSCQIFRTVFAGRRITAKLSNRYRGCVRSRGYARTTIIPLPRTDEKRGTRPNSALAAVYDAVEALFPGGALSGMSPVPAELGSCSNGRETETSDFRSYVNQEAVRNSYDPRSIPTIYG